MLPLAQPSPPESEPPPEPLPMAGKELAKEPRLAALSVQPVAPCTVLMRTSRAMSGSAQPTHPACRPKVIAPARYKVGCVEHLATAALAQRGQPCCFQNSPQRRNSSTPAASQQNSIDHLRFHVWPLISVTRYPHALVPPYLSV